MRERVAILAARRDDRSRARRHRQHPALQHPVVHVRAALEPRRSHRRAVRGQPEERAASARPISTRSRRSPTPRRWRSNRRGCRAQLLEETRRRERLQRYHSPSVVSRIMHSDRARGRGPSAQERDVTVMFCDIVGFTTLCEQLPPAAGGRAAERVSDADDRRGLRATRGRSTSSWATRCSRCSARHSISPITRCRRSRRRLRCDSALADLNLLSRRAQTADADRDQHRRGADRRHRVAAAPRVHRARRRRQYGVPDRGRSRRTRRNRHLRSDLCARRTDAISVRPLGSRTLRGRAGALEVYAVEDLAPRQN